MDLDPALALDRGQTDEIQSDMTQHSEVRQSELRRIIQIHLRSCLFLRVVFGAVRYARRTLFPR